MERVIGIDPGSRNTGYGIIDYNHSQHKYISSGTINVKGDDLPARLNFIYSELKIIIAHFQPQHMGIEDVFVAKNPRSALKLGQARGAAILAGTQASLTVREYAPKTVKKAVSGSGSADKAQVQQMVKMMLNIKNIASFDASDALAMAICYANSEIVMQKIPPIFTARRGGRWR